MVLVFCLSFFQFFNLKLDLFTIETIHYILTAFSSDAALCSSVSVQKNRNAQLSSRCSGFLSGPHITSFFFPCIHLVR